MTWAKYGVEFFDQAAELGLSDAAVRTHAEAIAYVYRLDRENVADLSIGRHLLHRFAGSLDAETAAVELVDAGLWRETPTGWTIEHHGDVIRQSLSAQRAKRERDRRAQHNQRNKPDQDSDADPDADVSTDPSADVSADSGAYVAATQTDIQASLTEEDHSVSVSAAVSADTDEPWDPPGEYMGGPVDWETGHPLHGVQDRA